MKREVTLEGDEAITIQSMIAEARAKWPILNEVTDNEVIEILIGYALTKEAKS